MMTPEQKQAIRKLRRNGLGYKAIATNLRLSVNTVKSYCRRQDLSLTTKTDKTPEDFCPVCGNGLHPISGKKKRRFCSDQCRMIWWNSHPNQVQRRTFTESVCLGCHRPFVTYGKQKRKYCSHPCYIKARFGGLRDDK